MFKTMVRGASGLMLACVGAGGVRAAGGEYVNPCATRDECDDDCHGGW